MVNGYAPKTLTEALDIRASQDVVPYAGGTDLMVQNKAGASYLFLNKLDELRHITDDGEYIRIGASVTFTEGLESDLVPQIMKEAVSRIASPAIRNAGTFGGNIGNASDKADSVLVGFAMDALVRLVSRDGERIIPVEEFFVKRGTTTLRSDELIAEILLPKSKCTAPYYYTKVGGRNALAISRVAAAGVYEINDGVVTAFSAAFIAGGGVFQRFKDIEATIIGKTPEEMKNNIDEYVKAYSENLVFGRGRVSAEYRTAVTLNLIRDYLGTIAEK